MYLLPAGLRVGPLPRANTGERTYGSAPPCQRLCDHCGLSVVRPVCVQDYYKSNQPISSELAVVIGPTNLKN